MTGDLDPELFDKAVLLAAEVGLPRSLTEFRIGFHPGEVELGSEFPFTRIVFHFTLESRGDIQFGYWKAIWEEVAWMELHWGELGADIRTNPTKVSNQILTQFSIDLEKDGFVDDPKVAVSPGLPILNWKPNPRIRYLRGSLAW